MIRGALQQRPALARFDVAKHDAEIARFRRLDERHLNDNRRRVLQAHLSRFTPAALPAEWKTLNHQFNLKARYQAIRVLMQEAGRAIQQLTPVFMMSPLSVANHLQATPGQRLAKASVIPVTCVGEHHPKGHFTAYAVQFGEPNLPLPPRVLLGFGYACTGAPLRLSCPFKPQVQPRRQRNRTLVTGQCQ